MSFNNTYFQLLPNEIIIKIIKNLDLLDILHFSETYPEMNNLFQTSSVIRNFNLSNCYKLKDLKLFFTKKMNYELINFLNINNLYWISADSLRRLIAKLKNLKHLYAIKTKLGLTPDDVSTYKKTKIEKLAITINILPSSITDSIQTIECCYIEAKVIATTNIDSYIKQLFPNLVRFWFETNTHGLEIPYFEYEKLFFKSHQNNTLMDPIKYVNKYFYHTNSRSYYTILCSEIFESKHLENSLRKLAQSNDAWENLLARNKIDVLLNPTDVRRLCLEEIDYHDFAFQEINFFEAHNNQSILDENHDQFMKIQRDILTTNNSKYLKKLCIFSCIFNCEDCQHVKYNSEEQFRFKKQRTAVQFTSFDHPMQQLFEHLSHLEVLNILACSTSRLSLCANIGYSFIGKCLKLKKLTLEIPKHSDGKLCSFLKDCKFLQVLKIYSVHQNESLNFHLIKTIHLLENLKDFVLVNYNLPLEKIIDSLKHIKSKKIERIVLRQTTESPKLFTFESLKTFIISNPQLIFVYFSFKNATKSVVKKITKDLKSLETHPAQCFLADIQAETNSRPQYVPDVHYFELILKIKQKMSVI